MFLAEDSASPPRGNTAATTNDKRIKPWFNASISAGAVTGGSVIADPGAWVSGTIPIDNVGGQLQRLQIRGYRD